ncbi:hypothetical protein A3L04_09195 [Thermococcus chitonophagus]|uniref:Arylsulfatase regulator (Fe-S oxidoreductase) n=1 Tax=Thermococcus chitonophagus TaxID=54262 RepID=A0A160VTK6_9EURY|nr:radical SAM protein [Thermococcus chitonophagus]ASJ17229.1 hypothetical protein A3L04_09195 [Thermococcus chitonophagus]CUX77846.1 Arylsulfatase regulator (Fe-S oxidoreductase) [Thermococcus chitonophagus]
MEPIKILDIIALRTEINNIKKYFIIHDSSGYILEIDEGIYDILKKLKEEKNNKLTEEEKIKLNELFRYINELPPLQLTDDIELPLYILGGSLNISQACNFSCIYCYADRGLYGNYKPKLMNFEIAKKSVDLLLQKSNKVTIITFFGGEPLLNFETIKEVVKYAKRRANILNKDVVFTITTNGYLLTPEIADFLLENNFDINISLDGYRELHNKNRPLADGSPTYDVVASNIKYTLKRAKELGRFRGISIKATLMPDQVKEAYRVYKHIKKEFNPPIIAIGFATLSNGAMSKKHVDMYLKELRKIAIDEVRTFGELNRILFGDFVLQLTDIYSGKIKAQHCGAGFGSIAIDVEGDIYPCQRFVSFKNFKLGNVDSFSLKDLLKFEGQKYTPFNHEPCKSCWLKFYCHNFCYYDNIIYTGKITIPQTLSCYYAKEKFKIGLWLYSKLYDEYSDKFEEYLQKRTDISRVSRTQVVLSRTLSKTR